VAEVTTESADPGHFLDETPPPGQDSGPALLLPAATGTEAAHAWATEDNDDALPVLSYGRSLILDYSRGPPLRNLLLTVMMLYQ